MAHVKPSCAIWKALFITNCLSLSTQDEENYYRYVNTTHTQARLWCM